MSGVSTYAIVSGILGWTLIAAAVVRASLAWGAGIALGVLAVLAFFRLVVPYGAWFSDPAALMIALRAQRRESRW